MAIHWESDDVIFALYPMFRIYFPQNIFRTLSQLLIC